MAKNVFRRAAALLAAAAMMLAAFGAWAEEPERLPEMRLHQICIGCADAYLFKTGDTVMLVDCGQDSGCANESANEPLLSYLDKCGVDHVDAHIITHWHPDHAVNVDMLSERYGTDATVVYGPSPALPERFSPLPHGEYRQMKDGDRVTVGPFELLCVGPANADVDGEHNQHSLNVLVTYGAHRFLMTGDWVDPSVRTRWEDEIRDVDVLSFPHHGLTPMCISTRTMRTLSPRVILIPGNMSGETAVKVFVINECSVRFYPRFYSNNDGNIQVISDGVTMWTAYRVEGGALPAGKQVGERDRMTR
ncbi:MAG: MBL fold metallo-hydrolase [Clostridia bacterium]|nr:MBL fold metallo-hydrolase [Clostridia bacterium]